MKVEIGPHRKHYTTFNLEDWWFLMRYDKYSFEMSDLGKDTFDFVVEWSLDKVQSILNNTINKLNSYRGRKERVRIDKYDAWNADHTLALIILPVLKQLRDTKDSYSLVDSTDVPKVLKATKTEIEEYNKNGAIDSKAPLRWDYILGEMIFAFESIVDDSWEDKFYTGDIDFLSIPVDADNNEVPEGEHEYYRMDFGPNHTSDFDAKGFDKYNKRINRGLKLFGKYYRSLWS